MPQPEHISVLGVPDPAGLDDDLKVIWAKCVEKLGFVPNVYSAYSLKPQRLRHFMAMYNDIMLAPSGLSKLEREMVAVVVRPPRADGVGIEVGQPVLGVERAVLDPHPRLGHQGERGIVQLPFASSAHRAAGAARPLTDGLFNQRNLADAESIGQIPHNPGRAASCRH